MTIKLPYQLQIRNPFQAPVEQASDHEERAEAWLTAIKRKAKENLENEFERIRIAYTNRYKIPRYPHFDLYTDEEMILETWEQYLFENPKALEGKGIYKRTNSKTGATYYETGDPMMDELEKAFAKGESPDLEKYFGHITGGKDIFRAEVFETQDGQKIAVRKGLEGVQEAPDGSKMDLAGNKVEHEQYDSDAWLKQALEEDPILRELEAKMKGVPNA